MLCFCFIAKADTEDCQIFYFIFIMLLIFQLSPTLSTPAIVRSAVIPSPSTISSIKRSMSMRDTHADVLKQKHLVQLDWVSTEDGSHILTVGVGAKVSPPPSLPPSLGVNLQDGWFMEVERPRSLGTMYKGQCLITQRPSTIFARTPSPERKLGEHWLHHSQLPFTLKIYILNTKKWIDK